jgi:hypothetical protein
MSVFGRASVAWAYLASKVTYHLSYVFDNSVPVAALQRSLVDFVMNGKAQLPPRPHYWHWVSVADAMQAPEKGFYGLLNLPAHVAALRSKRLVRLLLGGPSPCLEPVLSLVASVTGKWGCGMRLFCLPARHLRRVVKGSHVLRLLADYFLLRPLMRLRKPE